MTEKILFSPYRLGSLELKNRVVMAPMTRSRSAGNVPAPMVATYYTQRAEAGLIITEGTSPSPNGLGYARIPGMYSDEQIAGWKRVTESVHAAGGHIFVQLMHTGRISGQQNLPTGARVVAPSAIAAPGQIHTEVAGMQDLPVPHALTESEIESTIGEYVHAAKSAIKAGFDGIELHGANGYLIEQFLNVGANQRTDRWGGSVENRIRFAVEVARRCAEVIGADKVGLRISPYGGAAGMVPDEKTDEVFTQLAVELSKLKLVYLHVTGKPTPELKQKLRATFHGTMILSVGYDAERAEADLQAKQGDLIAFGIKFIANPKLVTKLKAGAPLAMPDRSVLFSADEKGYTDWP